jgi:hypothetical protein
VDEVRFIFNENVVIKRVLKLASVVACIISNGGVLVFMRLEKRAIKSWKLIALKIHNEVRST